jgi:hypothetical protein
MTHCPTRSRRWAAVNGDGYEYLIGQGRFGDEFVKRDDGRCIRRPVRLRDGEAMRPNQTTIDAMDDPGTLHHGPTADVLREDT